MSQVKEYEKETGEKVFTKQYKNDRGDSVDVHKVAYVKWLEYKADKIKELESKLLKANKVLYEIEMAPLKKTMWDLAFGYNVELEGIKILKYRSKKDAKS